MSKPQKKRLCWNCEGAVATNAETCPYCGVTVVPASLENVSTGFAPSYRVGTADDDLTIFRSPYATQKINEENEPITTQSDQVAVKELDEQQPAYDEFQRALWATMLLLTGSVFFLFSLALMLFSHNGVFTLKWDGSIWFIYMGVSLPLLIFGWRYLSQLEQEK